VTAFFYTVMPTEVGIHDFRSPSKVVDGGADPRVKPEDRHDVESYGGMLA
jgi:hypothetical protein